MNTLSPAKRLGLRWRFMAVLLVAGLAVSCTSDRDQSSGVASGPAQVGTGTIPYYEPTTQLLTLPELRGGDTLHTKVALRLKQDGSWAVQSTGSSRPATAADRPSATLVGANGTNLDLQSAGIDATLTVVRLHAGSRVFGSVAVQLKGSKWSLASSPQEIKTLHAEDFKSNANISANESHHVVLKSHPASGVQSVPMRLAARSYRFCMDAQAEGADTTALVDPTGVTVFTLKAGDACINYKAVHGDYKLEHRYGGQGASRTVFIAHQANTVAAKAQAQVPQSKNTAALAARSRTANLKMSAPPMYPDKEYWVVADPMAFYRSGQPYLYVACEGIAAFAGSAFYPTTMQRVIKDAVTSAPVALGQSLGCNGGAPSGFTYFFYDNQANEIRYNLYKGYSGGQEIALEITDLKGDSFELQANRNRGDAPTPVALGGGPDGTLFNFDGTRESQILDYSSFAIALRVFPDGLQQPALDVGQVALFSGPRCTGPAIIATGGSTDLASLVLNSNIGGDVNLFPGPFQSVRVGLSTRAIVSDSGGASSAFNQLTCTNIGAQPAERSSFTQATLKIEIDTVTMVISTDACELCNLAGSDFRGLDLTGVKLRGANLANALMSDIDLSRADLRFTNLQGAVLSGSNLEAANLCAAQLNASAAVPVAASLSRARMKNTNLALAVLDGVDFSNASFYSSGASSTCQENSCNSYAAPTCAGASGASIENANFDSAYLANVDMSGVTGRGVNFSNAILFGVSLAGANLAVKADAGTGSKFSKALLQGTDFSNADVSYADFTGAQLDMSSSCIQATLGASRLQFPGSKVTASTGSSSCVAGKQATPFCVSIKFPASKTYPATNCTNTCADGSRSGSQNPNTGTCSNTASCSPSSWTSSLANGVPGGIPTSSCQGTSQLCNAFANPPNPCW